MATSSASAPRPACVLITGVRGKTGRRVVGAPREQGIAVPAASRSSAVPGEQFGWEDHGTWDASPDGVDAVYLNYRSDLAAQLCEAALLAAVPTAAVLSSSWFDQNFTEGALGDALMAGVVALPAPAERTEPFLDADDIAACAAVALTESGHEGQIHELTGPDARPLAEVADILSQYLGRPVGYPPATGGEFAAHLTGEAVPAEDAAALPSTSGEVLDGRNSSTADGIVGLLGRPDRSFADFARGAALAGPWGSTVEVSA